MPYALLLTAFSFLLLLASAARADEQLSPDEMLKVKAAESARIQAIDKVYGAVVAVYGNDRQGGGSGVVYDPAGYALTNYHVVAGAGSDGWGGLADGRLYRWKLVGMDPGGDVAIIKLTGRDSFPFAELGNSDSVRVGDFAMAMGNPFILAEDQRPTVTLGVVSGVRRFQPGQTETMLVYGNCIQVDSSINPGNSGGPLFNMAGQVIGINGRGSFKERGRVNVGVGYAISIEQIKNFVPDLLATKIAMHGTLDAVFSNRAGVVVCSQLNLDSKIAAAGLETGDRLISFEGQRIDNANQLTNAISTLPANWPVEVVFEHEGKKREAWVRLTPLPYGNMNANPEPPMPDVPKPESPKPDQPRPPEPSEPGSDQRPKDEKPKDEKPTDPKPGDDKGKSKRPIPTPRIGRPPAPKLPTTEPGKIGDVAVNRAECRRIVAEWTRFAGGRAAIDAAKAVRYQHDIIREGKKIGQQQLLVSADGKWRLAYTLDDAPREFGYDGKTYWRSTDGPASKAVDLVDVIDDPLVVHAAALAAALAAGASKEADNLTASLPRYELQAADKALRQRSYRVRASLKDDRDFLLWFSMFDELGRPQVKLIKSAAGTDKIESDVAVAFLGYRQVGGLLLPQRGRIVAGLAERVQSELVATECRIATDLPADSFRSPTDAKHNGK